VWRSYCNKFDSKIAEGDPVEAAGVRAPKQTPDKVKGFSPGRFKRTAASASFLFAIVFRNN
jgi:hypothetical protein